MPMAICALKKVFTALVRLSPFDSAHRRHTSFAQVEVLPEAAQEDPLGDDQPG